MILFNNVMLSGRSTSTKILNRAASEVCAVCRKDNTDPSTPLQRCARCKTQCYCSRECQKADWKMHKKSCGQSSSTATASTPDKVADLLAHLRAGAHIPGSKFSPKFFDGIDNSGYLSSLPEKESFAAIIDAYRLRIEDEYVFQGDAGGLYAEEDPLPDFKRFLNLAEKRKNILPTWWDKQKRRLCERQAVDRNQWSCIRSTVEKSDITEHYNNPYMPMKLRMLAERVKGSNVME